jgi:hypothetical protein
MMVRRVCRGVTQSDAGVVRAWSRLARGGRTRVDEPIFPRSSVRGCSECSTRSSIKEDFDVPHAGPLSVATTDAFNVQTVVAALAVSWGTKTVPVYTASDGPRLLPAAVG